MSLEERILDFAKEEIRKLASDLNSKMESILKSTVEKIKENFQKNIPFIELANKLGYAIYHGNGRGEIYLKTGNRIIDMHFSIRKSPDGINVIQIIPNGMYKLDFNFNPDSDSGLENRYRIAFALVHAAKDNNIRILLEEDTWANRIYEERPPKFSNVAISIIMPEVHKLIKYLQKALEFYRSIRKMTPEYAEWGIYITIIRTNRISKEPDYSLIKRITR